MATLIMIKSVSLFVRELWWFGVKQASACLFCGFMLFVMITTSFWYPFTALHRYDFLFIAAVVFQFGLLVFRMETMKEAKVVLIFHIVATLMELFKTSEHIGSWHYPEQYVLGIGNVPLFTGFMYSAVGSYIARVWRIFEFRFEQYPNKTATVLFVVCVYLNFFTHHFIWDMRWLLVAFSVLLFGQTRIYFNVVGVYRHMPLLLGLALVSFFIWLAENIATYTRIWVYPSQGNDWHCVPMTKWMAWFLLMQLSFVMVSMVRGVHCLSPKKKP